MLSKRFRSGNYENNYDIVHLLIKHKIDINCFFQSGFTPIELAIRQNKIDIIKLLVNNGVNLNNNHLILALKFSNEASFKYFIMQNVIVDTTYDYNQLKENINNNFVSNLKLYIEKQ